MKLDRSKYFETTGFLKAADVKNGAKFTIQSFEEVKTRLGLRAILRLKETEKPFGLNATNFDRMIELFGDDEARWKGKKIILTKVQAPNPSLGGQIVDALRIR